MEGSETGNGSSRKRWRADEASKAFVWQTYVLMQNHNEQYYSCAQVSM